MKANQWLATVAVAAGLSLGLGMAQTQQDNGGNGGRGGGGGRFGGGNFDPAQMQQRIMDRLREDLEVKDDTEWKALEPLIQKVLDTRRQVDGDRMRGMFGRRNRGGDQSGDQGGGRRGGFFGQASPESEALQRAIDGKASNAEMKDALAKFISSRKARQAELEKAQADLRKVLSLRQEAIATVNGLL